MEFKLLTSEEDCNALNGFRNRVYSSKQPYLLNGYDLFYDEYSYNFSILDSDSDIIGASRCTPFKNGQWEASNVAPVEYLKFDPELFIQYNRVVIQKEHRNKLLHEYMFKNVAFWLFNNLKYEYFFSICEVPLLRVYAKFNILPVGDFFTVESRNNKQYSLIQGNIREIVFLFDKQSVVSTL